MIKTLTLHNKGKMEWGPCVRPTPMCLGVVSLLYNVSVLIISLHHYAYVAR